MKTAWIVFVGIFLASSVYGQTINACYNKRTGNLRISENCKKSETPISWNIKGSKGDTGPQGPKGDPGPTLIDNANQELGILVDLPGQTSVNLFLPSISAFVRLAKEGQQLLVVPSIEETFFEDDSCQGVGYTDADIPSIFLYPSVLRSGDKYVIAIGERAEKIINSLGTNLNCKKICKDIYHSTGQGDVEISIGVPLTDPCPPFGTNPNGERTSLTRSVVATQEVTLPFTQPIQLPLTFYWGN